MATIQLAVIGLVQDAALLDVLLDMAEVPVAVSQGVSAPAAVDVQLAQQGPHRRDATPCSQHHQLRRRGCW